MRLVLLEANHDSFHKVRFNEGGVTLIVGSRSEKGSTYNGVGKSLVVELLHFCLGSSNNFEFQEKLPDWAFTLTFTTGANRERHVVTRATGSQGLVILDDAEMRLRDYQEWLEERTFVIPKGVPGLSYRALLPHFLRRGLGDYVDPRRAGYGTPYEELVRNAFLLGVDVEPIATKQQLRQESENLRKLRDNFQTDPLLQQFYSGARDANIHLHFLEARVRDLEAARDAFRVAEDYYELQKAADELASSIERDKNAVFMLRDAISNIEISLRQQPDISAAQVEQLYGELIQVFREDSLKRLEDVSNFHNRLLTGRITRLARERQRLQQELADSESAIQLKQTDLDQRMRTLGESRALDQYTAIVSEAANVTTQLQKLRDYKSIELGYSNRLAAIDARLSEELIRANTYLEDTRQQREHVFGTFSNLVARFYPNIPAGISLSTNEGANSIRFDLDVRIENDSSDGINEVRILCYDMTILVSRQNHGVRFVMHDSRLFANMDVRQRATAFRVAAELSEGSGAQYIATLNPDEVAGMAAEFSAEEFRRLIEDRVVLELRDDSPAGKLLGIQVDLQYDRPHHGSRARAVRSSAKRASAIQTGKFRTI